jgi:hypothetical protein
MKTKKHLLFALGTLAFAYNANAQWVQPQPNVQSGIPEEGVEVYIYNPEAGQFLTSGNYWGSQLSVGSEGIPFKLENITDDEYYVQDYFSKNASWCYLGVSLTEDSSTGALSQQSVWTDYATTKRETAAWTFKEYGDGFRLKVGSDNTYASIADKYPNAFLGVNLTNEVTNFSSNGYTVNLRTIAYPLLNMDDEDASRYLVDWVYVTVDDYATYATKVENYTAAVALQASIEAAGELGIDTSDAASVYANTESTADELNAAKLLLDENISEESIRQATVEQPADISDKIANAGFASSTGWNWSGGSATFNYGVAEFWNTNFDFYQEIANLPAGIYRLTVQGFYRDGSYDTKASDYLAGTTSLNAYLYAGDESLALRSIYSDPERASGGVYTDVGYIPNTMSDANNYFSAGEDAYLNELFFAFDGGTLRLGIKKETLITYDWTIFDNFTLTYYGEGENVYSVYLNDVIGDFDMDACVESAAPSYLIDAVVEAYLEAQEGASDLEEANAKKATFQKALEEYEEGKAAYATLKAYLDDNAQTFLRDYGSSATIEDYYALLYSAQDGYEDKSLSAEEAIRYVEDLKEMEVTVITSSYEEGADITKLLENPDFSDDTTTGWTVEGSGSPTASNSECEAYMMTFKIYQTLRNMQAGVYTIRCQAFVRAGNAATVYSQYLTGSEPIKSYIFGNDNRTKIKSIMEDRSQDGALYSSSFWDTDTQLDDGSYIPNSMIGTRSYFDDASFTDETTGNTGRYWNEVKVFVAPESDRTLTLGFVGESAIDYYWTIFDNFQLEYNGANVEDLTALTQTSLDEAAEILFGDARMNRNVRENLLMAYTVSIEAQEDEDGNAMMNNYATLLSAINDAQSSVEEYRALGDALVHYREQADELEDVVSESEMDEFNEIFATVQEGYEEGLYDEVMFAVNDLEYAYANLLACVPASLTPMENWAFGSTLYGVDGIIYYLDEINGLADVYSLPSRETVSIPSSILVDGRNYAVVSIGYIGASGNWNSYVRNLYLPETLRYIGDYGLAYLTALTSIDIPESVEQIGALVFYYSNSLHEIRVHTATPVSVESFSGSYYKKVIVPNGSIHEYRTANAWSECTIVEEDPIELTINVTTPGTFGQLVLQQVDYLQEVNKLTVTGTLNSTDWNNLQDMDNLIGIDMSGLQNTEIPAEQFNGWYFLENVVLPNNLNSIGGYAFYGNGTLNNIEIPNSVTSIGACAFSGNTSLESVALPSGLSSVGGYVFEGCSALAQVEIPEGVTTLSTGMFENCDLREVTIPSTVTVIPFNAFENNKYLASLSIPSSVKRIENSAFYGCESLTRLELPEGLEYLGYFAFQNCSYLEEVVLPSTLLNCYGSFRSCNNIKTVYANALIPATTEDRCPLQDVDLTDVTLYVPSLSLADYKLADGWKEFPNIKASGYLPENIAVNKDYTWVLSGEIESDYTPNLSLLQTEEFVSDSIGNSVYQRGNLTIENTHKLALNDFSMHLSPYAKYFDDEYRVENGNDGTYASWASTACSSNNLIVNGEVRAENVTLKTHLYNNKWQFVSFPFDVQVADITPVDSETVWVIREYSGAQRAAGELDSTWVLRGEDATLEAGKGYILRCFNPNVESDDAVEFLITPVKESVNRQLIFSSTDRTIALEENLGEFEHNRSWNLIGNPYPSCYDTRFMDFTSPITVWNSYNSTYVAYSPVDDSYILNPGEAFFVQRPLDQESITFSTEGRQTDRYARTLDARAAAARDASVVTPRTVYNILLTNGENTDRTRVVLNESASVAYELSCDAVKFMSEDAQMPQIYTVNGDVHYAINERPLGSAVVELGIYIGTAGEYTILLGNNAPAGVVLEDRLNGTFTTVDAENGYTFSADAGEQNGRFYLHFTEANEQTGIDAVRAAEGNNEPVYNLNGQRIDGTAAKGIVIKNGQKILRK